MTEESLSNFELNRKLSNLYAQKWDRDRVSIEDSSIQSNERADKIKTLGDEWGNAEDVDRVVSEYIFPFIDGQSHVAEIGVGGGRIASRVAGRVKQLTAFDIAPEMIKRAKAMLKGQSNVTFELLEKPEFPSRYQGQFDFIYSFDVFVHLDLHMMWKYFSQFYELLKPRGKLFVHTSNLKAPQGWKKFIAQDQFHIRGHYFVIPEMVHLLAKQAGLRVIQESQVDPNSFYLARDYLVVLEKEEYVD